MEIVKDLLGAVPDIKKEGGALYLAIKNASLEIIKCLVEQGSNVKAAIAKISNDYSWGFTRVLSSQKYQPVMEYLQIDPNKVEPAHSDEYDPFLLDKEASDIG